MARHSLSHITHTSTAPTPQGYVAPFKKNLSSPEMKMFFYSDEDHVTTILNFYPLISGPFLSFFFLVFSRIAPTAHGGSQARGLIGAVAASLCQSYSNAGSEPRLRPTPQLTATPDP